MSAIQKLHIFFSSKEKDHTRQTTAAPCGSYSIDIQANDDWTITGKYRDNGLYALELKRIPQVEAKE